MAAVGSHQPLKRRLLPRWAKPLSLIQLDTINPASLSICNNSTFLGCLQSCRLCSAVYSKYAELLSCFSVSTREPSLPELSLYVSVCLSFLSTFPHHPSQAPAPGPGKDSAHCRDKLWLHAEWASVGSELRHHSSCDRQCNMEGSGKLELHLSLWKN